MINKDIVLKFKNYKLLKDKEFNLSNSHVYFVKGGNKKGKTSTKNSIISALTVKELTPDPITNGEQEGHRVITVPHRNGNTYSIHTDFTAKKIKWYVIDQNGKKIDKVTEIRNLFKYHAFTGEEFIKKSATAKGRREQLEILLELLGQEKKDRFIYLEAKESESYDNRAIAKQELDDVKKIMDSIELTDDDREEYKVKDKYIIGLANLEKQKEDYLVNNKKKQLEDSLEKEKAEHKSRHEIYTSKKETLSNTISEIELEIVRLQTKLSNAKKELAPIEKDYIESNEVAEKRMYKLVEDIANYEESIDIDKLNQRITNGRLLVNKLNTIADNIGRFDANKKKFDDATIKHTDLDNEVTKFRNSKKELFEDSNLKKFNIEYKDDYLYIDGFKFDENQVCTSDVYKIVARILISLNTEVPIIVMGNSSELDNDSLEEMNKLAEENGYIMIYDEVDRSDSDLKVVCYEDLQN